MTLCSTLKYRSLYRMLVLILLLSVGRENIAAESLRHCLLGDNEYIESVIKLALSYSDTEYTFEVIDDYCSQVREIEFVKSGTINFMWAGTTREMEQQLRPIRIPLYKGLLGHRIFLIRNGNQSLFDQIETLADLQKIRFGQGRDWGDTSILEAAGLTVVKSNTYPSLFQMLDSGRFEAFPRGLQEPWGELKKWSNLPLSVEQRIALVYPMPAYLFVNKDNAALAGVFEKGLQQAIADGSFDKNFYASPSINDALTRSNIKNRKVFRLDNPNLPRETPLDRKELWLDFADL